MDSKRLERLNKKQMKKLSSVVMLAIAAFALVGCGEETSDADQVLEPGQATAPSAPQGGASGAGGGQDSGPSVTETTEVQADR